MMKKVLAILFAVSLCLCLLPMVTFAAETETFTVHAMVPEDWGTPTLGAWGESGDLMGAWYGSPMTLGDDGWYSIEVPVTATGMIVCGANPDDQYTNDIKDFEIKELWIQAIPKSTGSSTVSYQKPTEEPPVEEVETFTVHAMVPEDWGTPTLGAWGESGDLMGAWYGSPMTLGDDGWYSIEVPVTATGMIVCGANPDDQYTNDIKDFEIKELWIQAIPKSTGNSTVSYQKPTEEPPVTEPPATQPPATQPSTEGEKTTFTVHAKVPEDWKDVTLGAWNDSGDLMGAWYGKPMTKGANGWYTIEVPLNATGMIITSDNGEGSTTRDIVDFEAKEMWIVACEYDDGAPTISYAAPATGDTAYLAVACGLLALSLCAFAVAVSQRKKFF